MSGPVLNVSGQLMTSPYTKTPISFVLPKGACVMIGLFLGTSKLLEYTWASLVASDRRPLRGLVLCMQGGSGSHRTFVRTFLGVGQVGWTMNCGCTLNISAPVLLHAEG